MSESSDSLCSDDLNVFGFFPSSPPSYRLTSPSPAECQNASVDNLSLKRCTLPLELIEHITELFHQRHRSFRALRPLSEANSQFRTIALRRYMASLSLQSAKQLTSLAKMHMSILSRSCPAWEFVGLHWVKSLTARSDDLANAPWRPSLLGSLSALRISFASEARSTQKIRAKQIFVTAFTNSSISHLTYLTSLALTKLWRIDVMLLGVVSGAFPGLVSLHLSCSEHLDTSCCWACFEDSSSAVVHSPIPNHFSTVASLTVCFSLCHFLVIKTLVERIREGTETANQVDQSPFGNIPFGEEMLENHINHYDSPRTFSRVVHTSLGQDRAQRPTGTVLSQSESPGTAQHDHVSYTEDKEDPHGSTVATNNTFDEVLPFPHGPELCPICSIMVSAPDIRTRELEASLALAHKIKSLRTIGWSSFFTCNLTTAERKTGDWQRATQTYVLRSGGRVRVRRRPWD